MQLYMGEGGGGVISTEKREYKTNLFDVVDGSLVEKGCFYYSSQEKNCTGEEVGQTREKTKQCLNKNLGIHQSCDRYVNLLRRCKYPRQRDACKKCDYQFFL